MSDLPRQILLATDGSSATDPELRAAADLSARTGAPVRVVHVGKDLPPPSHYGPDYNLFANDLEADRKAIGLAREQAAAIEARGGTVAEVYSQPGGRPGDEIVKGTRDEGVGLVVVGERGMGRFRYAERMSITATVVRDAWCPVLVVREDLPGLDQGGFDQERFPRKVLLATDGSPDAALAAREAVEVTGNTGAEFHVVHVSEEGGDHAERGGREVLDAEVERIEGMGGAVAKTHLLKGRPAGEIHKLAGEISAELVVIGGRVSGPERGPRAGASTSRSIVYDLDLPVLVVRGDRPARPLVATPEPARTDLPGASETEGNADQ
jgi:nucleotide-binding universal stress UspA family protein